MAPAALARYRLTFGKTEAMRFTGHLDLHRTWERTFRRAGLPLAYSEGFNPHPKINIGAALPLGCLSRGDLIDAWLEAELAVTEVESALRQAAPPGIAIDGVARIDLAEPVLQSRIESSLYEVSSEAFPDPAEMARKITTLMKRDQLPRERRGKRYDLRPLIGKLEYDADRRRLQMQLSAREGAVGRPEEVMQALDLDPRDCLATRVGLVLADPDRSLLASPSTSALSGG